MADEKQIDVEKVVADGDKPSSVSTPPGYHDGTGRRRSSTVNAEVLEADIFDERYEKTQRGLKSRHAQMIALGGTIGRSCHVADHRPY